MKKYQVLLIAVVWMALAFFPAPGRSTDVMDGAVFIKNVKVYIDPAKFDSTRYLSAPPTGVEEREEMKVVERWQEIRAAEMAKRSRLDSDQSIFLFADVLGEKFTASNLPIADRFFRSVYQTESNLNKQGKDNWRRLRPPVKNHQLKPAVTFESQGSYPSGHATFSWLAGIVLADMIPEKRDVIMNRAREMGLNRVIGGVHFPSDVEAGRLLAVACAVEIRNNRAFLADFEEARQEIRKVLGLPL